MFEWDWEFDHFLETMSVLRMSFAQPAVSTMHDLPLFGPDSKVSGFIVGWERKHKIQDIVFRLYLEMCGHVDARKRGWLLYRIAPAVKRAIFESPNNNNFFGWRKE